MSLRVEDATFAYDQDHNVFRGVSFAIDRGDIFCILGPNGSGKTTLLKCVDSLMKLTRGRILVDDQDIQSLSRKEIARKIGYLPQLHVSTFPFSVLDVAVMGRTSHLTLTASPTETDFRIAETNLKMLGISHLADRPYTRISGGERQLALIAMVLTQQPDILILDEPTAHLDFGNQVRILNVLRRLSQNGFSLIFTTHFPDHALHLSCNVALMSERQFISTGTSDDVITEENLRRIYGVNVKIAYIKDVDSRVCIPLYQSSHLIIRNSDNLTS